MDKQFDIAAIGTLAYDMILRTVDESVFARDTTVLEEVGISVGGGAMLSAIAAQRLGWKTTVVGKLCTDAFSDYCVDVLKKAGVDTSYVTRSETDTMSLTFALVRPNGDRHFLGRLGSNNRTLSPWDFDLSVVTKAKIVSYGSFLVLPELDQEMPRIFHAAREAGALTVADCANDSYHQWAETVLRCLPETDYFIPSQVEAEYLTGETDPAVMARLLMARGCRNLIIKLGEVGCYVTDGVTARIVPAFTVPHVSDTTGAGDNFVGGFMAGLLEGLDLFEAARYANATAAVSVTGPGGEGALRDKSQVLELLNQK